MTSDNEQVRSGFEQLLVDSGKGFLNFFNNIGGVSVLTLKSFRSLFTTRFEPRAFLYQVESLGVKSLGIGAATSVLWES